MIETSVRLKTRLCFLLPYPPLSCFLLSMGATPQVHTDARATQENLHGHARNRAYAYAHKNRSSPIFSVIDIHRIYPSAQYLNKF